MRNGPWIEIAPPGEATGELKRAYERILETRGRIPDIRSVMAGEPPGAQLRDIDFRVANNRIELEAPIRFFADKKPIVSA